MADQAINHDHINLIVVQAFRHSRKSDCLRPFPAIINAVKRSDAASQEQSLEPNGLPRSL